MTWVEWTGCAGFLCYFLYDINSITWKNKLLQRFFLLGTLLVAFSSVGIIADGFEEAAAVCGVFRNICIVFFRTNGVYSVFCITVWRNVCGGKSQKKNVYERHVCTVPPSRCPVVCTFLSGTCTYDRNSACCCGRCSFDSMECLLHLSAGSGDFSTDVL